MNSKSLQSDHRAVLARLLITAISILASAEAFGQVVIGPSATELTFPESSPETLLYLYVQNDGPPIDLLGVNLNLQIGDGGPEAGGTELGPSILSVGLFTGNALFAMNNNGPSGGGAIVPQLYEVGTLTMPGTELTLGKGQSLLGVAVLDTSAAKAGQRWSFTLDTLNGPTILLSDQGIPLALNRQGGFLTAVSAVPEPAEMGMSVAVLLGCFCWLRSLSVRWNRESLAIRKILSQ